MIQNMRPQFRRHGPPTRSSWGFLGNKGGNCDRACAHCFYAEQKELVFYDAESLLSRFNKYKHYYGLDAIDITGGEPTIYVDPALIKRGLKHRTKDGRNLHLEYLVRHCANIGLAPSVISHGQNYTEAMVKALEYCGLDTFELSIHGMGCLDGEELGDGNKRLVVLHGGKQFDGGFQRLIDGSKHMTRPIRWNSTVVEQTYTELPKVAKFISDNYQPCVYNMIQFMPYNTHSQTDRDFQVKYDECGPYIAEAVGIVEAKGWECNVRYFPPCIGHKFGFARNCLQHFQIQRDPWEWAFEATTDCRLEHPWSHVGRGIVTEAFFWDQAMRERDRLCDIHARNRQPHSPPCQTCAARRVCEAPDVQVTQRWGSDYLRPFASKDLGLPDGAMATDPNVFEGIPPGRVDAGEVQAI